MADMEKIKRSFWLTAGQIGFLAAEAARLGISVPDVLRRLIDKARRA